MIERRQRNIHTTPFPYGSQWNTVWLKLISLTMHFSVRIFLFRCSHIRWLTFAFETFKKHSNWGNTVLQKEIFSFQMQNGGNSRGKSEKKKLKGKMSSEIRYSILFVPGSFNRISISMAHMAHTTHCGVCVFAHEPYVWMKSVHYDFRQWLRATFSLLAVGITVNFVATIWCCYGCCCFGAKKSNKPAIIRWKKCVWDEAYNNGLPSTAFSTYNAYNVTMHGNYYSITPSGDMKWFSVL